MCQRRILALLSCLLGSLLFESRACTASFPRSVVHSTVLSGAQDVNDSCDFVIIGGGTSGLTVADRLTEDGKYTVLVIEHGPLVYANDLLTVYGAIAPLADPSKYLYHIASVPQVGLNNKIGQVWIGNLVGGGSAVNGMVTTRGTKVDYNDGAAFGAMIFTPPPEPVRSEFNITYEIDAAWGYNNGSGVYTSWPSHQYPGIKLQWNAYKEIPGAEFPREGSAGINGVFWYPTSMDPKNITRSFARTAHFDGLNRSNYHLLPNFKVTRIFLEGSTASGITFRSSNGSSTLHQVQTKREIILAAGAIHSPQVLQLSGIGPKSLLQSAGITVQIELPGVGQNFQDYPQLNMTFQYQNYTIHPNADDMNSNQTFIAFATELWNASKTGPYSIAAGNAGSFLGLPVVSPDNYDAIANKLDAQNVSAYLPPGSHPEVIASYRAQMTSYAAALRTKNMTVYHMIFHAAAAQGGIAYYHPLSRGTVNINITDPEGSEPLVDYRTLSNPIDIEILIEFMKFTRKYYLESKTLAPLGPVETGPGSNVTSDADLEAFIRNNLTPTVYHPVGACAMMPRELGGVVDENLFVRGLKNLRIIDASIIPTTVGINTCQTVYAIAERAADLIRASAQSSQS